MAKARPAQGDVPYILYGLSCSYFTGKLQAYFQTKGLPYRFAEMSRGQFGTCAQETGVVQLPCVETPLWRPASVFD